jgi:putative transposase
MARRKKHTPEQVVNLLRQIEVAVANGKTTSQACKEAEITEQTYYRWRKEYGGLQVDQARRLVLPIKSFSLPNSPRVKGSRSSS